VNDVGDPRRSRALWREQAILVGLGALALAGVVALTTVVAAAADRDLARSRAGLHPHSQAPLVAVAVVGAAFVLALLAAAVVHAVRVARFTLRRGAP